MAKFKKGDKVRYLIGTDDDRAKVHTVLETTMEGGREMVWFDDDGRGGYGNWADSLVKVNSRACNAKFKKGDKVWVRLGGKQIPAEILTYQPESDYCMVWDENGEGMKVKCKDVISIRNGVRSRNAVVAKALNACARNGGIDDFKVGDRVMVRSVVGFTPTDPKPGTVTAIYKSDNRIAVKKDDGGRGLFDASMVTKNACGTARNAGIAVNWKRNDAALKVEQAIDLLVGTHNSSRNWVDVDAEDKNALSMIGKSIADLNKAWKILLRERA